METTKKPSIWRNSFYDLFPRKPKGDKVSQVLVSPAPSGALPTGNIKSLDDWRAFIHQIAPVIVGILVAVQFVTEDVAMQWLPFVIAIADNLLSTANSAASRVRKTIYAAATTLQTGGLLTVLFSSAPQWIPVASAVLLIVTSFLARFYTPTTTVVPAQRTGPSVNDVAA